MMEINKSRTFKTKHVSGFFYSICSIFCSCSILSFDRNSVYVCMHILYIYFPPCIYMKSLYLNVFVVFVSIIIIIIIHIPHLTWIYMRMLTFILASDALLELICSCLKIISLTNTKNRNWIRVLLIYVKLFYDITVICEDMCVLFVSRFVLL